MFSAKRKREKEVPSWKLALEREEDEQPAFRADAPAPADGEGAASGAASSGAADTSSEIARDASADVGAAAADDDDDDDDVDLSAYDIAGGGDSDDAEAAAAGPGDDDETIPQMGVLYAAPHANAGMIVKRQRFQDQDGRDTLCLHSKGATEADVQALLDSLEGYKATRFVNSGMVFVLFADQLYAQMAMGKLQGARLCDAAGKPCVMRVEWAKRSLRPH